MHENYTCSKKPHQTPNKPQNKTNSSRIPPLQNYSLKHIYLREGLLFTGQCHFLIISKLIIHIYFEKQGWKINLFNLHSSKSKSCLSLLKHSAFHNWRSILYFINAKNYSICVSLTSLLILEVRISKLFQLQILGTDSFNTDFTPLNQNTNLASIIELELKKSQRNHQFLRWFPIL